MKNKLALGLILTFGFNVLAPHALASEGKKLSDQIPYPFYEVQKSSEGKNNNLMVLNSGVASLEKRLEIIREAKKNIEVEYFIYAVDEASRLLTQELVNAAKRGVKVRILVDRSAAVFVLDEYYVKALQNVKKDNGDETDITVKFYNGASLIRVSSINFRNHRKLISVDDQVAITGGRNIENDYFDLADDFNFLDRDVYIKGDIVPTLRKSFDKYFEHEISEVPALPERPALTVVQTVKRLGGKSKFTKERDNSQKISEYLAKMEKTKDFLTESQEDRDLKARIGSIGQSILSQKKVFSCPELTYSTDAPGGNFLTRLKDAYSDHYRFLRKTLFDKLSDHDLTKVTIASPYMINNTFTKELMNSLLERNIDITLYTNSLASTDAVYVAANLYKDFTKWTSRGIKVFVHAGEHFDEGEYVLKPSLRDAMWGMHAKTQVYESQNTSEVMIGTYNIDNRSNHYNSEMAIFCKGSPDITNEVKNSIDQRIDKSYQLHNDRTATNRDGEEVSIYGANEDSLIKMRLMALPSWIVKPLL
mgnify:CR=1 FL=1